jgi:hypothetical protein
MDVLGAGPGERLFGDPALGAPVDQSESLRRIADRDIVGDRQVGNQREFLKDAHDAGLVGRRGRSEFDLAPVKQHAPFIGLDDARHDLDEGGFAGAVLAQNGVNLAGLDGQIRLLEGLDAAIALGGALHTEQRNCARLHPAPQKTSAAGDSRGARSIASFTCFLWSGP